MKKDKIIYWITTGIVSLMMVFTAYSYLTNDEIKAAFVHLGFPSYFRVELAIAKIVGSLVLIIPGIPHRFKQFAYFGFALTFVSALIAHTSSGDPAKVAMMPVAFLIILAISYYYFIKIDGNHLPLKHAVI